MSKNENENEDFGASLGSPDSMEIKQPDFLFDVWTPENQLLDEVDRNHLIAAVIDRAPLYERDWVGSISK